jgi:AraC-like DNA-binding protein|tara:strand:- start:90 stop:980 length:891 start_codon:yes stop_codon:yes gene_type:complete
LENKQIKRHTINDIIEILGDTPQHEGLHIHTSKNKFKEIPLAYPFRSDNYAILLVVSGRLKLQLNILKHEVQKNEIIVIVPNTFTHILEMSSELEVIGIRFTMDFLIKNAFNKTEIDTLNFLIAKNTVKLVLNKEELRIFKTITNLLQEKINVTFYYKNEIILHTFNLLMYELATIYKKEITTYKTSLSREEELTLRFFRILEENFKNERTVQFYANILCVTSGHLSKVLKKISGKTASKLIDEVVIIEARILLGNSSLTIAQIADQLQFSDQSFFGKYFKKNTGISPTAYRKSLV